MVKQPEQSAWNLSQSLIIEISKLISSGSLNYRRGNPQGSFFDFEEIRTLIHTDLHSKEDKILNELTKKIHYCYSTVNKLEQKKEDEELEEDEKSKLTKYKNLHTTYVLRYRRKIMEYLGKYGYGVSRKIDQTKII